MQILLIYFTLFIAFIFAFWLRRKVAIGLFSLSILGAVIIFLNDLTSPLSIQL